jgi:hypothetical protein
MQSDQRKFVNWKRAKLIHFFGETRAGRLRHRTMVFSGVFVTFLVLLASGSCVVNKSGSFKALPLSGISNKIADLVTEAFKVHQNFNQNRQDAVTIGENDNQSTLSSDNNLFTNGFLKLLGFDGRKIGAAAMNGIVFIAQMVRHCGLVGNWLSNEFPHVCV